MGEQVPKGDASSGPTLPASVAQPAEESPLLVLRIGGVLFGVWAEQAEEVLDWHKPTPLPNMPKHVPGVLFRRGEAIALLDVGAFFNLGSGAGEGAGFDLGSFRRVVVVTQAEMRVGLVCDQVRGVIEARLDKLKAPDAVGQEARECVHAQLDHEIGLVAILQLTQLLQAARPGGEEGEVT